jgi:hypothetical protein
MSASDTIQNLLSVKAERTIEHVADELTRQAARVAWVRETTGALREAWRQRDDRCTLACETLDEEAFERLFEAEEAKVEAIHSQLRAVADYDRWPRHLYWSL